MRAPMVRRPYKRRDAECRVPACGVALKVGETTTERLIKYSLCRLCTEKDCVVAREQNSRWCSKHTTFHGLSAFRGGNRTCEDNRVSASADERELAALQLVQLARDALHTFKPPEPWLSLGRAGVLARRRAPRRTELGSLLSL